MAMRSILVAGGHLAPEAQAHARGFVLTPLKPYAEPAEMIAAATQARAEAIIVRMGRVGRTVIENIPTLRIIAKHGVGVDGIDLQAAASRGIPVVIAGGANAQSVAEQALALLMGVARSTAWLDRRLRAGEWDKSTYAGTEISGKSVGVIGFGAIGRAFLNLLSPFDLTARLYDPFLPDSAVPKNIARAQSLHELLAASDIISLHCPLTDDNRGMIGAAALAKMRPGSILINTARGELIDEGALILALRERRIMGAGLDTFVQEPPPADSPLWALDNLVASPHVGANTRESRARMSITVLEQIGAFLESGTIDRRNLVNKLELAA